MAEDKTDKAVESMEDKAVDKPVFCIYDSDDSDVESRRIVTDVFLQKL